MAANNQMSDPKKQKTEHIDAEINSYKKFIADPQVQQGDRMLMATKLLNARISRVKEARIERERLIAEQK